MLDHTSVHLVQLVSHSGQPVGLEGQRTVDKDVDLSLMLPPLATMQIFTAGNQMFSADSS